MLIAQISDLHIRLPAQLAYGRVDTAAFLQRCVAHLMAFDPRPDAVLVTGDLVDTGTHGEYAHLRALLAPLPMPTYLMVGNHDRREPLRDVFADHRYLFDHPRFVQYAVELGPIRFIALDTLDPPNGGGRLCDERLQWLIATLANERAQPVLLALHHPPFACGIEHMDLAGLPRADAERLAAIVAAHPEIERVLCGHIHRPIETRFAGVPASVCPSPAHQVALDLRPRGPSAFVMEPPAYQLHGWTPDGGFVTHTAYVGDFGDSYPFLDDDALP